MMDVTIGGLVAVPGLDIAVWASEETQEQALRIGGRVSRAADWLAGVLGFTAVPEVCAVGPGDWGRVTDFPVYGFPHFVGEATIVVGGGPVPFFDSTVADLWPGLSGPTTAGLVAAYGDPPRLDAFAQLLAIHELAHLYHSQAGFWFPQRWLSELFCNVALEGWVSEHEPELLDQLRAFPRCALAMDQSTLVERELPRMAEALEAGPIGPLNYGWYQMLLHVAAVRVWREAGADGLRRLYDAFRTGDGATDLGAHPAYADVARRWPAVG